MDFFQDKKLITKHFYVLYTLIAGIYYESYVHPRFRYCAKTYLIVSVIFTEMNCLLTLLQLESTNLTALLISITMSCAMLASLINVFIGYYWRKNLHDFFESIDRYSGLYQHYYIGSNVTINYNTYLKFPYTFLLFLFILIGIFVRLIMCCLTIEDSSNIDPFTNFYYPLLFPKFKNFSEYVLIYLLHSFLMLPSFINFLVSVLITSLVSIHLKNQAVLLTMEMKLMSDSISNPFNRSYNNESEVLEAQTSILHKHEKFHNILKERKLCFEKLAYHTQEWIKRYQKLIL